jgi:ferredoxin
MTTKIATRLREDRGMSLRARVDHDECVSSGACVLEAPDAFAYQDGPEQLAVVLPGATDLSDDELRDVAALCPVQAIHLYDEDGTEVPVEG